MNKLQLQCKLASFISPSFFMPFIKFQSYITSNERGKITFINHSINGTVWANDGVYIREIIHLLSGDPCFTINAVTSSKGGEVVCSESNVR